MYQSPYRTQKCPKNGASTVLSGRSAAADPIIKSCGRTFLGCALRAPNTFKDRLEILDLGQGLGLKRRQTKPNTSGTVPANQHTTIPNDSGPTIRNFWTVRQLLFACTRGWHYWGGQIKTGNPNLFETGRPRGPGKPCNVGGDFPPPSICGWVPRAPGAAQTQQI